jgi:formate dehydrogenase major subunit
VNLLTNPALDPTGKIPEFKFCAARITPLTTNGVGGEADSGEQLAEVDS